MIKEVAKGGSYLLGDVEANSVFTPEDFSDEHKMISAMTEDFVANEIAPVDERIEAQDFELLVTQLQKAGELGLLGAAIPEAYGGTNLDKISSTLISEQLVRGSSFALSVGAHVGIGTQPIALFGNEDQKSRYLPDLVSGKKLAAYCLTEPSSGSDALGAKTTAVLNEEGTHYILNGAKQFITNAAFADVFVVYAKVDGEKFTAFIVENSFEGVSTGPEEKKMGIKGSSTRPLILEDVKVPVENLLGEIGKGHVIAFNILNLGRYTLGAGCLGTAKWAIDLSVEYAKQRKQFGKALTEFPLIQKKIADMAVYTYATESVVYRTGGLMDDAMKTLDENDENYQKDVVKKVADYALECSVNKVFASECLDFVADEGVQIHGGYGFTQEYKVERIYRDSRINRIFEGTNEINRLLIPDMLFRKAMKGELPVMEVAANLEQELVAYMPPMVDEDTPLEKEKAMLASAKKIFLMVGGTAVKKYKQALQEEQEILEIISNLAIQIYALESTILRTEKAIAKDGVDKAKQKLNLTTTFAHESFAKIESLAKEGIVSMDDGDSALMVLSILKKLVRFKPKNLLHIKREIADKIIQSDQYTV
ncbi:acyl-CoA dehydrogenase family protein [Chengkuizengella axinellae]|uniref:Acyl-CoA dehydrogenase family protein n=1 Tax=Chengkuizengella axinellae TaxID=3064388 RepID=A0ABT9IU93_9BACL|nr:acyl-CoA dehydrogenase family protein [Chengkuizengella sp. 2205SS18-9]MDP5272935.1 acyl-CoA dehydrogenase family protein [Chengkuizengella sp. 2205SS18-9]